jgi:hypothetical protein
VANDGVHLVERARIEGRGWWALASVQNKTPGSAQGLM